MSAAAAQPLQFITDPLLDMKVLVVLDSVSDAIGINQMILGYLDILGIPYDVVDVNGRTSDTPALVTDAMLWDGVNHGHYYAIFVTTSDVWSPIIAPGNTAGEGLTATERNLIRAYERNSTCARPRCTHTPRPPITA